MEITAIWPHCLSDPILSQVTAKYFGFQIIVAQCETIQLKSFA